MNPSSTKSVNSETPRSVNSGATPRSQATPRDSEGKALRANTYLQLELFKWVLISTTKQKAEQAASWVTGTTTPIRGYYMCNHLKTKLVIHTRWPGMTEKQTNTCALEALIVFIEKPEEWELVKGEAMKFKQIPIRVICCESKGMDTALSELKAIQMKKTHEHKAFRVDIDKLDREEFKKIQEVFQKYDADGSGSIESSEIKEIAISLGVDPNDQDFIDSMMALNYSNDGSINFAEFITWWKVGRQNTTALPRIYHMKMAIKNFLETNFRYSTFMSEIDELNIKGCYSSTKQNIYFKSPGEFSLKTFFESSVAFGGPRRLELAEKFLKQFTTNVGSTKLNWISILFRFDKKNKINGEKAKAHLENFKDICMKWAEDRGYGAFVNFLRNLLIFETSCNENSVIMAIRLKGDIEDVVKAAVSELSKIIDALSTKRESCFMEMKAHSNLDIYDSMTSAKTLGDFFKICEFKIASSGFRNRLRSLILNIPKEKMDMLPLLQFLFVPYSLDLELTGDFEDITDPTQKKFLETNLSPVAFFLDFLKTNISPELLKASDDIDIAINAFNFFANVKFYSEKMFSVVKENKQ